MYAPPAYQHWMAEAPRGGTVRVSLLLRLERRAQLVGECSEALGGRSIAFRPLAHFLGLARFHDGLRAQADAPTCRIDFQHDDLDVGPDRKGSPDIAFLRDAGFAHEDDTCTPGGEE